MRNMNENSEDNNKLKKAKSTPENLGQLQEEPEVPRLSRRKKKQLERELAMKDSDSPDKVAEYVKPTRSASVKAAKKNKRRAKFPDNGWVCSACRNYNFETRNSCNRCKKMKADQDKKGMPLHLR